MKKIKKRIKDIAIFLSGLILLQSCSTYKTPVTLQQAAKEEKAVKIVTVDDDSYNYKYIVYEDEQFYGVKDNLGENAKFPVDTEEVADVLMKKGFPWWAWVLMITGGIFLILIFIGIASDGSAYYEGL